MTKTISVYSKNAKKFFEEYESIGAIDIHKSWIELVPTFGGVALDIGAGSGRDAAYLAGRGYEVIAVEPSDELRLLARNKHNSEKISWIKDKLPELREVSKLDIKFEIILLSAVWMHVPINKREKAFQRIVTFLYENAFLIISLRHGISPDDREMFNVSFEELAYFCNKYSLVIIHHSKDKDVLSRGDVWWETVVMQFTTNPQSE